MTILRPIAGASKKTLNRLATRCFRTTTPVATKSLDLVNGFESKCLHVGYLPDETTSRGVPLYRTTPYVFESTKKAANLFALSKLYQRTDCLVD